MAQEFTAKFKVDISDLKKNINEAIKDIKLANSTFKAETAGMEAWSKSADGLSAKIQQLKTILENQKTILSSYQSQLEKQNQAYEENGKRAEQLKAKLQDLVNNGISKTDEEYKKYETALKGVIKEQQNNEKAADDLKLKILEQEAAVKTTEKQIGQYTTSLDKLQQEQKEAAEAANRQDTAYESLEKTINAQQSDLDALKSKYANVVIEQGKNSDSAKELAGQIDKLSGELKDNKDKMKEADDAADDLDKSLDDVTDAAENTSGGFTVLKGAIANLISDGIRLLARELKDMAQNAIDYESAFADVEKTVDGTSEQLAQLNTDIREMSKEMPQSAADIAEVAAAAGQLGIATDDIASFTETMIMLGDSTNLSSDEAATALARFASVTKMSADDYSRLGSVIVDLGNNYATTESEIVAMGTRLAAAGTQVGISQSDILALAAALSSVGLEAEGGGTAFSKLMINMQLEVEKGKKGLDDFAKVAGVSGDEFKRIFEQDATKAITMFIEGLSNSEERGISAIKVLDDMGIAEVRLRDSILRAVNAKDMFSDAITTGKNAWEQDTALQTEAEKRYETTASKIEIMKNNFTDLGLTLFDKFQPAIQGAIEALTSLANNTPAIVALTTAIGALIAAFAASKILTFATEINNAMLAMKGLEAMTKSQTVALIAQKVAQAASTVATEAATAAQWLLNAAMEANPIGLVVVAVAALTAAIVLLIKKYSDAHSKIKDVQTAQEDLAEAQQNAADAQDNYMSAVDRATDAQKRLLEVQQKNKISGMELYKQVQDGVLDYADMNDAQREVYKAYVDNMKAQKDLVDSGEALKDAKEKETVASLENQIALGKEAGSYEEAKEAIIDAYEQGSISAEKARELIGTSMSEMSRDAQKTFMEDIPADISEGLDPKNYETPWQKLVNGFSDLGDTIASKFKEGIDKIAEFFSSLWEDIKSVWSGVGSWFNDEVITPIVTFFTDLSDTIHEKWTEIITKIKDVVSGIVSWFSDTIFQPIYNFFMKWIWPILSKIIEINEKIIEILLALAKIVMNWIKEHIVDPIVAKIKELYDKVKAQVEKIWEAVKAIWDKVVKWFDDNVIKPIRDLFEKLWEKIKDVFGKVKDFFKEKFEKAKEAVTDAWEKIADWFKEKWEKIKEVFKPVTDWFGDKFSEAWEAIKDKFSEWGEYWGGLWDTVKEKFSALGTKIGDAISNAVKTGINGVIELIEKTINKGIGLINGAINLINKALPKDEEISKIEELKLPRLAQGGVVKRATIAQIGEAGAEAVVPLEKNKQWIRAVANSLLSDLKGGVAASSLSNNSSVNKVSNFTQIINAPKQPSRIELYRQTRNLLDYARVTEG